MITYLPNYWSCQTYSRCYPTFATVAGWRPPPQPVGWSSTIAPNLPEPLYYLQIYLGR